MLRIRSAQKEVFKEAATEWYIDDLMLSMRDLYGPMVEDLDDDTLRRRVRYGVDRAVKLGITTNAGVAVYVGLMFGIAPHFDSHPDFQAILDQAQGTPDEKVQQIPGLMPPDTWRAIRESAGSDPWAVIENV